MGFLPATRQLSNAEIARLVPHIFLPRKLPTTKSDSLSVDEANLLRLLRDIVVEVNSSHKNKCLNKVADLFHIWTELQQQEELEPEYLSATISSLEPGDVFALYIRAQNAGFMLSVPEEDAVHDPKTVILSTFSASPKLSDVMSSPGDLAAVYPASSVHISMSEMLTSDTLACQLSNLCSTECELAMPKQKSRRGRGSTEPRDVADPLMISQFITGVLTDEDSDHCSHFKKISKTIRDQVNSSEGSGIPFRRSGLWMVAKVVLQLSFINKLDKTNGLFLYKMVMLKLMSFCCQKLCGAVNTDVSMQMLAKLARRIRKLEQYHANHTLSQEFTEIYDKLQDEVLKTMEGVKSKLDMQWRNIVNEEKRKAAIPPLPILNFEVDTKHLLPTSKKHLFPVNDTQTVRSRCIPAPQCPPRYYSVNSNLVEFPVKNFEAEGEENLGVVLCDFEIYVRRSLDRLASVQNCQSIRKLLEQYIRKAKPYYANDPIGTSRMILTALKIVQILDNTTMMEQALLKNHKSGVDVDFIQDLLIPQFEDMKMAQELAEYFEARNKARNPSLIEQATVSSDSISSIYARNDSTMSTLRRKILADADVKIAAKEVEVQRGREYCQDLRRRASCLSHDSVSRTNRWGCPYTFHPKWCTKCSLDSQAERYRVSLYERPLPTNEIEQYAVVFELLIPDEISCLRDTLFFFITEVFSASLCTGNSQIHTLWTEYSEISSYRRGTQEYVNLGTTTKLYTSSYSSRSPENNSDDEFIINNNFNCRYVGKRVCLGRRGEINIKNICSFSIEKDPVYKKMDEWLKSTSHNQNEVLAAQYRCPQDMSLAEFKDFGSLRAGHRLQLRNIYRTLQQETLSFHKEPVFSLICQSIWQAGPESETEPPTISRQCHEDLDDSNFALALLQLLDKIRDKQSNNWTNYYSMLTLIVLTLRILSLARNECVEKVALNLLRSCRSVAESWAEKVEGVLSKTADYPKDKVEELRLNLINVSVCIALTYWVDDKFISCIMNCNLDLQCWLKAIARIKDNTILSSASTEKFSISLRNLLRYVRIAGVKMENQIQLLLERGNTGLHEFIKSHWAGARKVKVKSLGYYSTTQKQVYQVEFESSKGNVTLHIDLVCGNFLLNGSPVLPSSFTGHKDYIRVFSDIIFEVQPTAGETGTYVTALKYHKSDYKFEFQRGQLVVTETQENKQEFELVPHHVFGNDLPFALINDYSHWWSRADNTVLFRPVSFSHKQFQSDIKYILNLATFTITEESTKNLLIDVNSNSHKQMCRIMGRMEHTYYIHMLWTKKKKTLVYLPRMDLKFEVEQKEDGPIEMISHEFPGMKLCEEQKFGTFVGLNQGILLKSSNPSIMMNAIFLIPHGNVSIHSASPHQVVKIDITKLRKPEYFDFEVDERLCELRAGQNQSGWTYLALLHAATASSLPDPFTSLTGTEAALRLLQSPRCWSCQPFEAEASSTLAAIAQISPSRQYCPRDQNYAEYIEWPNGVSSLAAHDGYHMVVQMLIEDSQRLSFLNQSTSDEVDEVSDSEDEDDKKSKFNDTLITKAYWRNRFAYTEQAQVSFGSELQFMKSPPATSEASTFDMNPEASNIFDNVRTIAHLGHVWSCMRPASTCDGYLMPLLISDGGDLTGVTELPLYAVDIFTLLSLNLRHSWLDLYVFARTVKESKMECEWTMLLSAMAFKGASLDHLKLLHIVAVHPDEFKSQDPPPYVHYMDCNKNEFDSRVVQKLFQTAAITFEEYESRTGQGRNYGEEEYEYNLRKYETRKKYDGLVTSQVNQLTNIAQTQWPVKTCTLLPNMKSNFTEIRLEPALLSVNATLTKWYMNRELQHFLKNIEKIMFAFESYEGVTLEEELMPSNGFPEQCQRERFFEVTLEDLCNRCDDVCIDDDAETVFKTGFLQCEGEEIPIIQQIIPTLEPFPWDINSSCPIGAAYMKTTKDSWEAYRSHPKISVTINDDDYVRLATQLEGQRSFYSKRAQDMWQDTQNVVRIATSKFGTKAAKTAGLLPRVSPSTVFPLISTLAADKSRTTAANSCKTFKHIHYMFGATAVLWTLEQRANRCLKYIKAEGGPMEVALKKELATRGHENWSPIEHPEWLLLELEMDLVIRPVQIEVANAMLKPKNDEHAVMQLNMGEGKTTVIIPMVVATLGNGQQLCRVTVLKSLFHVNRDALAFKLGGLLNRRVYTLPCRRDLKIGSNEADLMQEVYKECVAKRGVVLTLPEYRLSFELKGYEKSRNGKFGDARSLIKVHQWLTENVRDVLDESDEILQVKYQLVYTIGEQLLVGGGRLRWSVAQKLLKLVPSHLEKLTANAAECNRDSEHPERFPYCRLLKLECYQELCKLLVEDVLAGNLGIEALNLTTSQKNIVARYLIDPNISEEEAQEVLKNFDGKVNSSKLDILLILRGLLACGVLSLVLNKRWRVNFGVNPNGNRFMAVPFRAKDVAAERTEFGHPDVAILCTILSYYYSGLTTAQLNKCFEVLYQQQNCVEEYERWVSNLSSFNPSIQSLSGINLKDYEQRTKLLYPALLKNTAVVDFWLDKVVFPKEAKQFGFKMTCSAWDLCSDESHLPVTGFSGTNDSKLLLPLNIVQRDLPKLQGTNGEVLRNLLKEENNNYEPLLPGTTNEQILEQLVEKKIHLLLDVGALMTSLDNETLAKKWLDKMHDNTKEAAIYFDISDKLVVTDRYGRTTKLALSPYRGRMDKCIIYLDDFHTRGTDLKIPRGTKGCVTLGKGITKDKLVQGCMRMRMLGEGHTVCFLASMEVDNEIKTMSGQEQIKVTTKDVLAWAMENGRLVTRDGFIHWTAGGFNYVQKKSARMLYYKSDGSDSSVLKLGHRCADRDILELMKMYGTVRKAVLFPKLASAGLQFQLSKFSESMSKDELGTCTLLNNIINDVGGQIVAKCEDFVSHFRRASSLLDEEQERELEQELEEEREIHRPSAAQPAQHELKEGVTKFVKDGICPSTERADWAVKLPLALKTTSLWPDHVQENSWGQNIFVTTDYVNVIKDSYSRHSLWSHARTLNARDTWIQPDYTDDFLRLPTWVAAVNVNGKTTLLILSPYEVNQLMPIFRSGNSAAVLHMYAARLHPGQDSLFQHSQLMLPSFTTPVCYKEYTILNANLSLFSGNLYFESRSEQDAYLRFLGLIPQPRSIEEQEVFDKGQTCNGFVPLEYRESLPHITSLFKKNPSALVRGIIDRRCDYFPGLSHVFKIIVESKKPFDVATSTRSVARLFGARSKETVGRPSLYGN